MSWLGSWNMKTKPTGLWRWVLRVPVTLFRWHLGFLFGKRFVRIDHVGRRTSVVHQTVVEVVEIDQRTDELIVCSGTGPTADWYRNLQVAPAPTIQLGNRRWTPVQRMLDDAESAQHFARYEIAHPKTARRLLATMGNSYDGSDEGRVAMMADMPMVAFSLA